jgi:hypothetical protein
MSAAVKRRRSPGPNNDESIPMAGAPDTDVYKSESKRGCMGLLWSLIKIIVFLGTILALLSMLVSVVSRNS